ncbi:MAG: hypothetical protein KGL21_07415, partial [Alphaproteobacteria bacterium]|nr:hypothetical protein [Alphaproteobacteria bacterium]
GGQAGRTSTAFLFEGQWDFDRHESLFGRIESVDNDELFNTMPTDPRYGLPFRVTKYALGYAYRLHLAGPLNLALGGTADVYTKPAALDSAYGKFPVSGTVFAKLSLGH